MITTSYSHGNEVAVRAKISQCSASFGEGWWEC